MAKSKSEKRESKGVSRRTFLKTSGMAVGAAFPSCSPARGTPSCQGGTDVAHGQDAFQRVRNLQDEDRPKT
jgi:hypothetical protein